MELSSSSGCVHKAETRFSHILVYVHTCVNLGWQIEGNNLPNTYHTDFHLLVVQHLYQQPVVNPLYPDPAIAASAVDFPTFFQRAHNNNNQPHIGNQHNKLKQNKKLC